MGQVPRSDVQREGGALQCHLSRDACYVPNPCTVDRQTPAKILVSHNLLCKEKANVVNFANFVLFENNSIS